MSFDIEELKIVLSTNIKVPKYKQIELTSSVLYHPELEGGGGAFNKYPYFTLDLKYPLGSLAGLAYKDRVKFFFDKETFSSTLNIYKQDGDILTRRVSGESEDDNEYYQQRDRNIQHNVMGMLDLLFPTQFPVINDLQTSYDIVFNTTRFNLVNLNPMRSNYYSYLKLDGEIYTFKKVVWINDFLNHPVYQNLLTEYHKLWAWSLGEKAKAMRTIRSVSKDITKATKRIFEDFCIKYREGKGEGLFKILLEMAYLVGIDKQKVLILLIRSKDSTGTSIEENWFKEGGIRSVIAEYDKIYVDDKHRYQGIVELYNKNLSGSSSNPGKELSPLIKSESFKTMISAMEDYLSIESLFSKTFDNAKGKFKQNPNYYNFVKDKLNKYKPPTRDTSNVKLQLLINGGNDDNVSDFYSFLHYVYNKFISPGRTFIKTSDIFKDLLRVGICGLKDHREIYVYTDFIQGEVSDKNVSTVKCPYYSNHLGNELDFQILMALQGKTGRKDTNKWNISRNRMIFSIKDASSESSDVLLDAELLPMKRREEFGYVPPNAKMDVVKENRSNVDINDLFISKIASNDTIPPMMQALNQKYFDRPSVDQYNLLKFIEDNKKDLYKLITVWGNNMAKYNKNLDDGFSRLIGSYNTEIGLIEKDKLGVAAMTDSTKQKSLDYSIDLLKIYIDIVKELQKSEQTKYKGPYKGGYRPVGGPRTKKKHYYKLHKRTRRNRAPYL